MRESPYLKQWAPCSVSLQLNGEEVKSPRRPRNLRCPNMKRASETRGCASPQQPQGLFYFWKSGEVRDPRSRPQKRTLILCYCEQTQLIEGACLLQLQEQRFQLFPVRSAQTSDRIPTLHRVEPVSPAARIASSRDISEHLRVLI